MVCKLILFIILVNSFGNQVNASKCKDSKILFAVMNHTFEQNKSAFTEQTPFRATTLTSTTLTALTKVSAPVTVPEWKETVTNTNTLTKTPTPTQAAIPNYSERMDGFPKREENKFNVTTETELPKVMPPAPLVATKSTEETKYNVTYTVEIAKELSPVPVFAPVVASKLVETTFNVTNTTEFPNISQPAAVVAPKREETKFNDTYTVEFAPVVVPKLEETKLNGTNTTTKHSQDYFPILSSDAGDQNIFNFSIKNDQNYDFKLFWVDWNHRFKFYSTITSGIEYFQNSFANHTWVLSNTEKSKCFAFKLAQTHHFMVTDKTVKVSELSGHECNPDGVYH